MIRYSENIPELLFSLNLKLVISSYHANKIIFINASSNEKLNLKYLTIKKPMGISISLEKLIVGIKDNIVEYKNIADENSKNIKYIQTIKYFTNDIDVHDVMPYYDDIVVVNTKNSCLTTINKKNEQNTLWKPFFINEIKPYDFCHLNGICNEDNKILYATALSATSNFEGWRLNVNGGVLLDVDNNNIILSNLSMPHSPRLFNNNLYLLLSATGEVIKVDILNSKYSIIFKTDNFIRGLSIYAGYAFIGISKQRRKKSTFKELSIAKKTKFSGIFIIELLSGKYLGKIEFIKEIEEIYDIKIFNTSKNIIFAR